MARINSLQNFLTDVATAIKNKKGDETAIPAANFDTEISNLPSQGVYQHKQVTVVDNGSVTVLPDTGYDAIDQLDVTVTIPLQQKTYTFTQNTTTTIIPEQGYAGFSQVGLEINVPSSQINNQDKTITENGQYTADSGYTGIGTATVNIIPPIKMYNTREEMMLDTTEPEHEYGVVYGDKTERLVENTTTEFITFVDNVKLSSAITSSKSWYTGSSMEGIELNFSLRASSAYFRARKGSGTIAEVRYTSTDGITYTKTSGDKYVDLGEPVLFEAGSRGWMSEMEEFILNGGKFFEGMYEWVNEVDEEYWDAITNLQFNNTTVTSSNEELYLPTLMHLIREIYELDSTRWFWLVKENNQYVYYTYSNGTNETYVDDLANPMSNVYVCCCNTTSTTVPVGYKYILDLEHDTWTKSEQSLTLICTSGNYKYYGHKITAQYILGCGLGATIRRYDPLATSNDHTFRQVSLSGVGTYFSDRQYDMGHKAFLTWHHVKTEFTLEDPHQLLPGINALGKHGDVVGDGSIYQHIDILQLLPDFSLANGEYIMSQKLDANGKDITPQSSIEAATFNSTPGLAKREYIMNYTNLNYSPIQARKTGDYIVVLCDNDTLQIYENSNIIKTISLTANLDYTNPGLSLVTKIHNGMLLFTVLTKSYYKNEVSADFIMGYMNTTTLEEHVYYNTNIQVGTYYANRYDASSFVDLYYDNGNVYTLLDNVYDGTRKIYQNAQVICSLPSVTATTNREFIPYVCTNTGIYVNLAGSTGNINNTNYIRYQYGNTTYNTYSFGSFAQYAKGAIGRDDNYNAYLLVYCWVSGSTVFSLYSLSGNTKVQLYTTSNYDVTSRYYYHLRVTPTSNGYIITPASDSISALYCISLVPTQNIVEMNSISQPSEGITYPQTAYHSATSLTVSVIEDKIIYVNTTMADYTLVNTNSKLLDLTATKTQAKKLYMKI